MSGVVYPEKLGSAGEECHVQATLPLVWTAETKVGTSGKKKKCKKKKQKGKQGAVAAKKKKCKKRKKG